jgi:hypothetical protein
MERADSSVFNVAMGKQIYWVSTAGSPDRFTHGEEKGIVAELPKNIVWDWSHAARPRRRAPLPR